MPLLLFLVLNHVLGKLTHSLICESQARRYAPLNHALILLSEGYGDMRRCTHTHVLLQHALDQK